MMINKSLGLTILFFAVSLITFSQLQVPAFPTAEGYGMYARGGRGGQVVAVTNIQDYLTTETPVVGSLRWAASQFPGQPLTIVFRTSGVITLKSDLRIKRDFLTIAGQTAPGDGIVIRGGKVNMGGCNHLIMRHLRMRIGLRGDTAFIAGGSIGIENASNFIIDHCTFGWSGEENMTMYDNTLSTVQWCILHEGLFDAGHLKGARSYGSQWGGQTATYHHNLLAHHNNRTPRFNGARSNDARVLMDYINNVNYNWGKSNSAYGADIVGGTTLFPRWHRVNFINNYYKPGPARPGASSSFFVGSSFASAQRVDQIALWYMTGNFMEGSANTDKNENNYLGLDASAYVSRGISAAALRSDTIFPTLYPVKVETAQQAYESVLAKAGAFPRDTVDRRIVNEVRTGTATGIGTSTSNPFFNQTKGIIDNPSVVGGYPEYNTYNTITDADNDGMDDAWETANGLNPNNPDDRNLVTVSGYTVLEVYLNSLVSEFIELKFATSVPELEIRGLRVFPSVTSGMIYLQTDEPVMRADVISLSGVRLRTFNIADTDMIDVKDIPGGSYILQVYAYNKKQHFKFFRD